MNASYIKRLSFALAIACFVGLLIKRNFVLSEPVYQGRKLSYWLDLGWRSHPIVTNSYRLTTNAIFAIGPDAITFALKRAERGESVLNRLYRGASNKLPHLMEFLPEAGPSSEAWAERTGHALGCLGPTVVPQLVQVLDHKNSNVRLTAVSALLMIGREAEAAVPALVKLLDDNNRTVQITATETLNDFDVKSASLVDIWLNVLRRRKSETKPGQIDYVKENAVRKLGEIGPSAAIAVPELTTLAGGDEPTFRAEALIALWRIEHDTNSIPLLIAELDKRPVAHIGSRIITTLGEIGPDAKAAIPTMLSLLDPLNRLPGPGGRNIPIVAQKALKKIDPEIALPNQEMR